MERTATDDSRENGPTKSVPHNATKLRTGQVSALQRPNHNLSKRKGRMVEISRNKDMHS